MSKALWAILLPLCLLAAAAWADPVSPGDDQTLPQDTAVAPAPDDVSDIAAGLGGRAGAGRRIRADERGGREG